MIVAFVIALAWSFVWTAGAISALIHGYTSEGLFILFFPALPSLFMTLMMPVSAFIHKRAEKRNEEIRRENLQTKRHSLSGKTFRFRK